MYSEKEFIQDLKKLTNIDCGTHNIEGVNKIASVIEQRFKDWLNFDVKRVTVSKKAGDILISCNKSNAKSFDVLLLAHMDTVYPEIAADNELQIRDNKAYGLGSLDMKSGLLQGLYALKSLDKTLLDKLSICFLCNPDEEIGSIYSEATIIEYAKKSKCALILESAGEDKRLVNSRYGIARYEAHFEGLAAHGSTPEAGISALKELSNFINVVDRLNKPDKTIIANVGLVKGGSGFNVVPDKATLGFEFRFTNIEGYNATLETLKHSANNPAIEGSKINLKELSFKPPLNNSKEDKWLEDIALKSCEAVGLTDFSFTSNAGGSDGNITSYFAKIPTLDGLGPVGYGFHNKDEEHIELKSVENRIQLLQQILQNISKL